MNDALLNTLNSIIANATPLVIAALGETISERAGVINLSLNGSILLAAMFGFAAATVSGSLWVGVAVAMFVGALVALLVAVGSISLRQDQVAIGFVLTLLAGDLARFLGKDYQNVPGPIAPTLPVPVLRDLPVVGTIFFNHNAFVYLSFVLLAIIWVWLFRTRSGLELRAIGERPEAAFARGAQVNRLRYLYVVLGGALVGLAGAAYSLGLKAGWQATPAMDGDGWIALAIVIFGGWHPGRVVFGAYLFAALRALASVIQRSPDLNIPIVLLNTLPWLLMLTTLILVSGRSPAWLAALIPRRIRRLGSVAFALVPYSVRRRLRGLLASEPPAALGTRFEQDGV